MFASAVSSAKLHPAVAARNQRSVIARAGKYDEELIKTAVRSSSLPCVSVCRVALSLRPFSCVPQGSPERASR
jgi:hypothetical protein